jgi:hypothetical protein
MAETAEWAMLVPECIALFTAVIATHCLKRNRRHAKRKAQCVFHQHIRIQISEACRKVEGEGCCAALPCV